MTKNEVREAINTILENSLDGATVVDVDLAKKMTTRQCQSHCMAE